MIIDREYASRLLQCVADVIRCDGFRLQLVAFNSDLTADYGTLDFNVYTGKGVKGITYEFNTLSVNEYDSMYYVADVLNTIMSEF